VVQATHWHATWLPVETGRILDPGAGSLHKPEFDQLV
jgi:hypothetical protein